MGNERDGDKIREELERYKMRVEELETRMRLMEEKTVENFMNTAELIE
jgi:hypothetical protein